MKTETLMVVVEVDDESSEISGISNVDFAGIEAAYGVKVLDVFVAGVFREITDNCSECGKPWTEHYRPELLKFKNGPHGTFGLMADHTPHIKGVHMERA